MSLDDIDPTGQADPAQLRAENLRLRKIIRALVDRAERSTELQGTEFSLFQTTVMLDEQVKQRTAALQTAFQDIARINRALTESEARFRAVVEQSLVGIAIVAEAGFNYCNPRLADMFGYSEAEMMALSPLALAPPEVQWTLAEKIRQGLTREVEQAHYQLQGQHRDGHLLDIEVFGRVILTDDKPLLVNVVLDVSERCRAERAVQVLQAQLKEQSVRDALTGLYNRRDLMSSLERELRQAQADGRCVGVVMGDLDHFKHVNDRYGHPAGDEVLRQFARSLVQEVRSTDLCFRYGGEEFLLILPGVDRAAAHARAEAVRRKVEATPVQAHGQAIAVTASFGVACFPDDGTTTDQLITQADAALYAAKAGGRNRVHSGTGVEGGAAG